MNQQQNMELWDLVSRTNPANTKPVNFGKRKFTAIDAYSQIKQATMIWGAMGTGWGFHADMTFGQLLVVADGTLWYAGDRSKTVQAYGGARVVSKEGVVDPDAAKKAYTDALTKALSFLGFNADVFEGKFDDNRYVQEMRQMFQGAGPAPNFPGATPPPPPSFRPPPPPYPPPPYPQAAPVPMLQQPAPVPQPVFRNEASPSNPAPVAMAPQPQQALVPQPPQQTPVPQPLPAAPNQAGGDAGQGLAILKRLIEERGIPAEVQETLLGFWDASSIEELSPNQIQIAIQRFQAYPSQQGKAA